MISSPFHCRQETYAAADINPSSGRPLDVGQVLEESGASKKSAGFFHKGILQAFESDHRAGGRAPEVKVVANGHCHSKSAEISSVPVLKSPTCLSLSFFYSLGELQARERRLAVLRRWRVSSCFVLVVNQPCSKFLPSRTGWDADSNVTRACVRDRSYSGYSKVGFDRRFRIYDVSEYGETIRTYKRTESNEVVDDMVLVGRGAPPPFEGVI